MPVSIVPECGSEASGNREEKSKAFSYCVWRRKRGQVFSFFFFSSLGTFDLDPLFSPLLFFLHLSLSPPPLSLFPSIHLSHRPSLTVSPSTKSKKNGPKVKGELHTKKSKLFLLSTLSLSLHSLARRGRAFSLALSRWYPVFFSLSVTASLPLPPFHHQRHVKRDKEVNEIREKGQKKIKRGAKSEEKEKEKDCLSSSLPFLPPSSRPTLLFISTRPRPKPPRPPSSRSSRTPRGS